MNTVNPIRTFVVGRFLHMHRIKSGIVVIKYLNRTKGVLPRSKKKAMIGLISTARFSFINERVK
jgi:hypothetical protein